VSLWQRTESPGRKKARELCSSRASFLPGIVAFAREAIESAVAALGIRPPKNQGDLIYSFLWRG